MCLVRMGFSGAKGTAECRLMASKHSIAITFIQCLHYFNKYNYYFVNFSIISSNTITIFVI